MRNQTGSVYRRAVQLMPGGVNSPVRSFRSVGGKPLFVREGKGAYIIDVSGRKYVDYCLSFGPLILGHAHPHVVSAAAKALRRGTTFGITTELEVRFAEILCGAVPSMEQVRLVNSGTEAVMSALRAARGFKAREKVVKFEGGYHGHTDSLLVKAGSGLSTLGQPDSLGVTEAMTKDTFVLPYNNAEAFKKLMQKHGDSIAAVIVEPVAGNMGVVTPWEGFLETLREETSRYGTVLIFDEVITGFRFTFGGVQKIFKIRPDMTCLGKIIGGGFPLASYGGRKDIMQKVSPSGPVYQAGTLAGNPVAVSAGLATLQHLKKHKPFRELERKTIFLVKQLKKQAQEAKISLQVNQFGSMFTCFFTEHPVVDYEKVRTSDTKRFALFFKTLLKKGVYFPPSAYEACFLSTRHEKRELEFTLRATREAFKHVRGV